MAKHVLLKCLGRYVEYRRLTSFSRWSNKKESIWLVRTKHSDVCATGITGLRRVIVAAAVRAFTLEHGKLPDQLQDLVPEYLDEIPIDPFDKDSKPIQYELTEVGYRLTNEPADSQNITRKPLSVWVPPEFRP